jgi:hypothetical protein
MGDGRRSSLRREQGVERCDAVRLGGRHRETPADVVQARLGDLADPVLQGMERREQQVAAAPGVVAASGDVALGARVACSAGPPGRRRPQERIDRRTLGRRRERPDDVEVHRGRVYGGSRALPGREVAARARASGHTTSPM